MSPFLVMLFLALILPSCHDSNELKPNINPQDTIPTEEVIIPEDSCDFAVIVYIAAENSLGKQWPSLNNKSFAELDIEEMVEAAADIPLSNRLFVYFDSPLEPQLLEINSQEGKILLETRIEENSADPVTFEKILKRITTKYPSHHQALVMWSHASGWIPGPKKSFGIDNLTNGTTDKGSEIEIADLRQAFENLNIHFDYIMFDACFMQCIETAYELRKSTDYIIASPAEIPGNGAPYNLIMPLLMEPSEENCKAIISTYFADYEDKDGAILSVVKTSELDSLLNLTRELCPDYYTVAPNLDTYGIQPYCVFMEYTTWKPEYFDMGSVMNRLLSQSDYSLWVEQLDKTIINKHYTDSWLSVYASWDFAPNIIDPDHLALTSIFVPNAKYDKNTTYNESIKQTQWYKDFTRNKDTSK